MSHPSDDDPDAQILNAERHRMFRELGAGVNSRCAAFVKYGRLVMERCKMIRNGDRYSKESNPLFIAINDAWQAMSREDKKRGSELRRKMTLAAAAAKPSVEK